MASQQHSMRLFYHTLLWAVFALALYFPIFLHVDSLPLMWWDESRNALTAWEMHTEGWRWVKHFFGAPDAWDTKPPLLVWIQAFLFKLLGPSVLAVRLPSSFAVLGIVGLLLHFSRKTTGQWWAGIIASLVLVTSSGFIKIHVARTGDHDALLSFWLLLGFISCYKLLEGEKKAWRCLALAISCGFLTKSIMGFAFVPAFFLAAILVPFFRSIWRKPHLYMAMGVVLLAVGVYYGYAHIAYPGHLKAVWDNEWLPRFLNKAEGITYNEPSSKWYYVEAMIKQKFVYYIFLLPIVSWALFQVASFRRLLIFSWIVIGFFLGFISLGTVNDWYDGPVYPLFALLIGWGVVAFRQMWMTESQKMYPIVATLFVIALIGPAYVKIISEVYRPKPYANEIRYGIAFEHLRKHHPDIKKWVSITEILNTSYLFYEQTYNDAYGYKIRSWGIDDWVDIKEVFKTGTKVLVCDDARKAKLYSEYSLKTVYDDGHCVLVEIQ